MKIRHVAADLFQAHRLTDVRRAEMTNPIVDFRNFVDKTKNCKLYLDSYSQIQPFSSNTNAVGRTLDRCGISIQVC